MHIIPPAVKIALVKHTDAYPADVVFSIHAKVGGGGVTVTFAPDLPHNRDRTITPCVTATYFVTIEEIRANGKKCRI